MSSLSRSQGYSEASHGDCQYLLSSTEGASLVSRVVPGSVWNNVAAAWKIWEQNCQGSWTWRRRQDGNHGKAGGDDRGLPYDFIKIECKVVQCQFRAFESISDRDFYVCPHILSDHTSNGWPTSFSLSVQSLLAFAIDEAYSRIGWTAQS